MTREAELRTELKRIQEEYSQARREGDEALRRIATRLVELSKEFSATRTELYDLSPGTRPGVIRLSDEPLPFGVPLAQAVQVLVKEQGRRVRSAA